MGFLSDLLGTSSTYSADMKSLSREQIRLLVSRSKVRTLDAKEEVLVEEVIEKTKVSGRTSLRKIDEQLRSLVSKNAISIHDKLGVMKQFEQYFEKNQ